METLTVLNKQGKQTGKIELPDGLFLKHVNTQVLHQAVVMYRAASRQGTASTKERAFVSGGGVKPYRQKGTGRARVGSTRSPLFQGGGVTFGPHPRDYRYTVPKKIKRAALRESLNAKLKADELFCIEEFKDKFSKTKEFAKILTSLKLKGKILAVLDGCDESVLLASRNIPRFEIKRSEDINAYDILSNKSILLTKTAFQKLIKRIQS